MHSQFQRFVFAVLFVALSVFATPTRAAFTSMVVIGDSLSDQGNVYDLTSRNLFLPLIPPAEYTDGTTVGRFTNGQNYIDYLSSSLNLSVTPSRLGGSNYAYGGARTDSASIGGIPIGRFSLLDQRDAYFRDLRGADIDAGALHVVYGGSNDVLDVIERLRVDPAYNPAAALNTAVTNISDILVSLAAANANNILVPNIPNLGLVPIVTDNGNPVMAATELSVLFNQGLASAIDAISATYPETRLFEFDVFNLFTDAYMNPLDYGFTNVTEACYSMFVRTGGATCANPSEYLSWDGLHPTTAAHELLASKVVVPVPASVWLFGSGLLGLLIAVRRRRA